MSLKNISKIILLSTVILAFSPANAGDNENNNSQSALDSDYKEIKECLRVIKRDKRFEMFTYFGRHSIYFGEKVTQEAVTIFLIELIGEVNESLHFLLVADKITKEKRERTKQMLAPIESFVKSNDWRLSWAIPFLSRIQLLDKDKEKVASIALHELLEIEETS
jgi:hypothetical protein